MAEITDAEMFVMEGIYLQKWPAEWADEGRRLITAYRESRVENERLRATKAKWRDADEQQPEPHKGAYRVWAAGQLFDATPCYGLHEPWWVPCNGYTGSESEPIGMTDTKWMALPKPPKQGKDD